MILNFVILLSALLPHLCISEHLKVGIVNGTEAKPHSRPYMVSIQNSYGEHLCAGFLVTDQFVMSAAHCSKSKQKLTAVVGAHDLSSSDFVQIPVKTIKVHPEYKKSSCLHNDIMLLELAKSTKKIKNVASIQIPEDHHVGKGRCSTAGWGKRTTHGPLSNRLREADVHVLSSKQCKALWGRCYRKVGVMCAGGAFHGFCKGDSGGPLVCNGIAVGIASFYEKNNCDKPSKPNVYVKIADFLPWIRNATNYVK